MPGNADFAGNQLVAGIQRVLRAVDHGQPLADRKGQRQQPEVERLFQHVRAGQGESKRLRSESAQGDSVPRGIRVRRGGHAPS